MSLAADAPARVITRRSVAAVTSLSIVALLLAACTRPAPAHPSTAIPVGSAAQAVDPLQGAGSLALPGLPARLGAPTSGWREALVVPFGAGSAELGLDPGSEAAPRGPTSFAVAPGGVWIADPLHHRLVRYALPGGSAPRQIPTPADAPLGDLVALPGADPAVWAVLDGPRGLIAPLRSGGLGASLTVHDAGVRYRVTGLLADHAHLLAEVAGGGATGLARIDTRDGSIARWAPGVPAGGAVAVQVGTGGSGGGLEVHWFHYQHQLATGLAPIELRGAGGSTIPAVAETRLEASGPGGAIAWIQVSSASGGRAGAWIAAIPPDPTGPIRLQPLPRASVPSTQVRHLAVDEAGSLWCMVTRRDGIHLFRRAASAGA